MFRDEPRVFGFAGHLAPVHAVPSAPLPTRRAADSIHPRRHLVAAAVQTMKDRVRPPRRRRVLRPVVAYPAFEPGATPMI